SFHSTLESDLTSPLAKKAKWGVCPLPEFVKLMRSKGVTTPKIYCMNGGFFIVAKEAIEKVLRLFLDFWESAAKLGYIFNDEQSWSYVTHMLCKDIERHTVRNTSDIWASDWTGQHTQQLPDGSEWIFTDFMTGESFFVNPAIVHLMINKDLLLESRA